MGPGPATWEQATDAAEVHRLLLACDRHQAEATGTPVPTRNPETTRHRVAAGQVHVLRRDGRALAAVTVTPEPPFPLPVELPPTAGAYYLSRLSVAPEELARGSSAGFQCVRRAVEVAVQASADRLRAQANPDLAGTWELLLLLGFEQVGPVQVAGGVRAAHLEKRLPSAGPVVAG